jgi:inosine-uridine nucleoside N-ribohydrolase
MFEENYLFHVPDEKKIKVILDTDVRNEVDDQFAIMHALMTPKFDVRGIIAAHFGHDRIEDSMEASYEELQRVLQHAGLCGKVRTARGSKTALKVEQKGYFGNIPPYDNEGVRLIIDEAMALAPGEKLYVGVLGPMTDIACALMLEPAIESRLIIVWNGGNIYPNGGMEFNLVNDITAANIVLGSKAEIWQVPTKVYAKPRVGLAELQLKVYPCGEIGRFLFTEVVDFFEEMKHFPGWPRAESLDICDLTVIGLMMEEHHYCYSWRQAPSIGEDMFYRENHENRPIRVYDDIDGRYILEDFFSKLQINYKK